ncbi:MAG: hypothetical protein BroJett040_08630 [Oligoflexia bacterium]|nr:MAG: hypothetical protein BroJett040_08630 [Oligoflexia bacterium]
MKLILSIWWAALFIKLALTAFIPLSFDEAYYWVWSHNLQLSYFDHPPMVAWLLWLGHFLEPFGHAVRWPIVIIGHLAILTWTYALKPYLSTERLTWLFFLLLFSPLIGYGSMIATPDVPVIFFWGLSCYFALRALKGHRPHDYALLGASLGLGFCSKYHIVLFALALLIYLTVEKKWSQVSRKGVGLVLLVGFIFSLPVIIWNIQNDFVSFRFQMNHGFGREKWDPLWTISYPLGQLICLFPTTVYIAFRAKVQGELRLLLYLAWFPIAFFFISSFRGVVEINWPVVGHFGVYTLAALAAISWKNIHLSVWFWVVAGLVALTHVAVPWFPMASDKLNEPRYFQPIYQLEKKYSPLYASTYQMASALWYANKKPTYKLWGMSRHDFFDELQKTPPSESRFYLVKQNFSPIPDWIINQKYRVVKKEDVPPIFEVFEVSK